MDKEKIMKMFTEFLNNYKSDKYKVGKIDAENALDWILNRINSETQCSGKSQIGLDLEQQTTKNHKSYNCKESDNNDFKKVCYNGNCHILRGYASVICSRKCDKRTESKPVRKS